MKAEMDMVELAEAVAIEVVHHGRDICVHGSLVGGLAPSNCVSGSDGLGLNEVESVISKSRSVSDSWVGEGARLTRWQADERRV